MTVTLNGKTTEVEGEDLTVTQFVAGLEIGTQPVLVELNGEAILVREFDDYRIKDGDIVEVIRMVAGG
ncbi:MAG: sulfur carrier protein ThiS [Verrucomicrobiales bacterium]|jgi:thiamine biosynthesis protein ThiS|nr:sulfur carrier protein ThiS [Verrucomicrobiales bacterium]